MATFTVRVELHGATPAEYAALDAEMALAGCIKTVQVEGVTYALPSGEYNIEGLTLTCKQLCNGVKVIADRVKPGAWVLVSEAVRRAWFTERL